MRSTPPRRPSQPFPETRTSNHVGKPWMLDGKMFRVATGTPMRRIARANSSFADAEPEPFTLANLMTMSLVALIALDMASGLCRVEEELLHVPRTGGAALSAQTAMQAEVLSRRMRRRRGQSRAKLGFLAIRGESDAVHRTNVDAGVAFNTFRSLEDG